MNNSERNPGVIRCFTFFIILTLTSFEVSAGNNKAGGNLGNVHNEVAHTLISGTSYDNIVNIGCGWASGVNFASGFDWPAMLPSVLGDSSNLYNTLTDSQYFTPYGNKYAMLVKEALEARDGWRHLYRISRDGKDVRLVTPGDFDIIKVDHIDTANGWVYYTASPDDNAARYLFRSPLSGEPKVERLTPDSESGFHEYEVATNSGWAFHTFSTLSKPPTIDIVSLPGHASRRVIVDNEKVEKFLQSTPRVETEFFILDIGDGIVMDAWMMKPPDFDPGKKYPLLMFVYGEPASQTVVQQWRTGRGDRHLWFTMLAQQGYIVASVDNRGTPAPKGRAWRKSVYGQIGILASADQAKAVRTLLAERPYLDPQRVGSWGWSGGGQMTLHAMFRYPDIYRTGVAIAFVSDQRLYDTIYQERYMGLPDDNAEGFEQGSPITHAAGLEGNLLLIHGTADDNVHYQNAEQLVDTLIALNKTFTFMMYPDRSHSIDEKTNTKRHLYTLMTNFLHEHLPLQAAPGQ